MGRELTATPKIITEAFNNGFVKMENGNFLVPRGIENNQGHFNLTSDLDVCGILGHEVDSNNFNIEKYKNIKVRMSYTDTNTPRLIDNAPTSIYVIGFINKQIDNGGTKKS